MAAGVLSLGKLGYATGINNSTTAETSIKLCAGTSSGEPSLGDFSVGGCLGPVVPDTTPNENSSATVTFIFSNPGSRFSRISTLNRNFT